MTNDIFTVKLVNGSQIMFRGYLTEDGVLVASEMPYQLTMSHQGLGLIPWLIGVTKTENDDDVYYINMKQVLIYSKNVDPMLKSDYLNQVSGLDLSATAETKKIIMP